MKRPQTKFYANHERPQVIRSKFIVRPNKRILQQFLYFPRHFIESKTTDIGMLLQDQLQISNNSCLCDF